MYPLSFIVVVVIMGCFPVTVPGGSVMKTIFFRRTAAICVLFALIAGGLWAVDVQIQVPQLVVNGTLIDDADLEPFATALETQIETDPDIAKYTKQSDLAQGFADAGSASSLSGMFRIPRSYKIFSAAAGFGIAVSLPELKAIDDIDSGDFFKEEGDAYGGIAVHPFNLSVGINLGFLLDGLRANAKFGYFDFTSEGIGGDFAFSSFSVGGGLNYSLIKPKSVPLGIVKWEGLVVSSGLYYQRNEAKISVTPDDNSYATTDITTGDVGLGGTDVIGTLVTEPEIHATITSSTFTVPLEVATAVRVLYIIDLMVGAGVDFNFGSSEVALGSSSRVNFEVDSDYVGTVSSDPGSIDVVNKTTVDPRFIRPRLMAALGISAGPVKFELPFTVYFDSDGNTYVTGITAGFML